MNLEKSIKSVSDDIVRQSQRLALLERINQLLSCVEFDGEFNNYVTEYGGLIHVELYPCYGDDANKNLRPLVHEIAQKFGVKFDKSATYDGASIEYIASFEVDGYRLRVKVTGVVPDTCKVVETEERLSDEEIEDARREALESVKTTRITRKIVCD